MNNDKSRKKCNQVKQVYEKMKEVKLRVRFDCTSRMAHQKHAGPINQRSVDRKHLLLKWKLHVHKHKSNIP